ncbi:hypothetical protein CGCF415_v013567 [Colletotrichum fructicola]|nr:hypothetical protein CGCF415_v013567 [Colletotrichum fructicola]
MPFDHPPAPPFYALKEDDKAALAVVSALVFLIYAIIGITLKLIIRLNITSLKAHDVLLLMSVALLFVQTTFVITACNHGLGRHQNALRPTELEAFYKLFYASSIFATATAATTKLSLCLLIQSINNHGKFNIANHLLFGVVITWMVSGITAEALQCSLPRPWLAISLENCPRREVVYLYNGIMDISTDVVLCFLPVAMMWKVQTTVKRKQLVIALFGTRIIVPILSIPGLISTHTLVTDYKDSTWHAVPHVIWLQCTLGLSVMTACIPSLKGVIDSLMGSTSVATIQAPYELTASGGDESGRLHATAIVGGTNSRYGSHLTSGAAKSRATRSKSLRPSDWPVAVQGHVHDSRKDKEEGAYRTESNEDLVPQRHESRSSSHEGSYKSSEAGYRL